MKISCQELSELTTKAILKYGYSEEEAEIIRDMLMYAQLRGNDQGIVKLIGKGMPKHEKAQQPTVEKETPTTAIINANLSMEASPSWGRIPGMGPREPWATGHERSRTQV